MAGRIATLPARFALVAILFLATLAPMLRAAQSPAECLQGATGTCGEMETPCNLDACACVADACVPKSSLMLICEPFAAGAYKYGTCEGAHPGEFLVHNGYYYTGPSLPGSGRPKYLPLPSELCSDWDAVAACRSAFTFADSDPGTLPQQAVPRCSPADGISDCTGCPEALVKGGQCRYDGCSGTGAGFFENMIYRYCGVYDNYPAACADAGNGGYCRFKEETPPQAVCTIPLGQNCMPGAQAPYCCASGFCSYQTGRCCMDEDFLTQCSSNDVCCTGLCDLHGTNRCVTCLSEGAITCHSDDDCCSGLECKSGTCKRKEVCKRADEACQAGNCCLYPEVAQDLYCDSLNSPSAPACRSCANAGEKCGGGFGCCVGTCGADGTCPHPEVAVKKFGDVLMVAALAALGMLTLVALVYMGGEFLQNPRMLTWAKTEAMQAFVSVAVASVAIFAVFALAEVTVGEIGGVFNAPTPLLYRGNGGQNVYGGALLYLENLAAVSLANVAQLRYNLGAYEIRTSYTKYDCDAACKISLSSVNLAIFGGETVKLAITNNLLGTATVAYLSTVFQYFTLQYVINGLFYLFLPIAIIVRSMPFMRQFGGALMGIFIALYVLYPLMLVADAFVAPSLAKNMPGVATLYERSGQSCETSGENVFGQYVPQDGGPRKYMTCVSGKKNERELGGSSLHDTSEASLNEMDDPGGSMTDLANSIRVSILIFLAAVFLPALNFIVIAALGRDLSRLLGEETDISKLGQMV